MQSEITVTPAQLPELLLNVAVVRPVFIWGAPGIGKSALVEQFAASLGLECQTLLGTQLAAEDLIGVPQLVAGADGQMRSRFAPPEAIARLDPYCLFLDELNASSHDVQKAMYSLVLDRRLGSYRLPAGSIVIGAGNRAIDNALARPMSAALVNRMVHVHLRPAAADWLVWASSEGLHPWVVNYLAERPDHLWHRAPKTEEPFSTPRSWHILSDCLISFGGDVPDDTLEVLAGGLLTSLHATSFRAWVRVVRNQYGIEAIIKGDATWPTAAGERDVLYFLAETFRARLVKDLSASRDVASPAQRQLAHRAKAMLADLAEIAPEVAQVVVAEPDPNDPELPGWFLTDVIRDLPRLVAARS